MRGYSPMFKGFVTRRKPDSVMLPTADSLKFRSRALSLASLTFFLSACTITTDTMSRGAQHSAAVSEAGGAPQEVLLTKADVVVPEAFQFIGQSEDMLALHFGAPDLTRREGDAIIYQFRTNTRAEPCVILAFVYEVRGDVPRIRHLSVRRGASEAAAPEQCMRRLALAHKNRRAG